MQTILVESDLKEAGHEANLLLTQADEDFMEATEALFLAIEGFNKKVRGSIQKYEEAKAILKEVRDFTSDEYIQALCDEVNESLTVRVITFNNFCVWLNYLKSLIQKQVLEL